MPVSYASFRVDPTINFENFTLASPTFPSSPSVSNFSRPMSYRPGLSSQSTQLSFALSDSSRRSSYVSSKGPVTPQQDPPNRDSIAGPKFAIPDDDFSNDLSLSSFMSDSHKSTELDLTFAVESVMRAYQPTSTPNSPVTSMAPMLTSPLERPRTAGSLAPPPLLRPMNTAKVCPVHGVRQSVLAPSPLSPKPPCPVHGHKQPTSSPLSLSPLASPPRLASDTTSPEPKPLESAKTLPVLPFLKHDPFESSKGDDHGASRPKSAGAGATRGGQDDGDFILDRSQPSTKQSAPSIMSTRSTRSIRKGFSRMRRMLNRAKPS